MSARPDFELGVARAAIGGFPYRGHGTLAEQPWPAAAAVQLPGGGADFHRPASQ